MGRAPLAVRPISDAERAIVERAVALAPVDDVEMPSLETLGNLQVVGRCSCGCASVDFAHLARGEIAELVADAVAETPAGEGVGVLVWAHGGEFSGLEIVSYSDHPAQLPLPHTIKAWDRAAE